MTDIFPNPENLHHAYIIYGDLDMSRELVIRYLSEKCNVKKENNPDFFNYVCDNISIDVAHEILYASSRKSFSEKRIFLVEFNSILHEAQNALLKLIEEPDLGTHFFFLTQSKGFALPTIISRVVEIDLKDDHEENIADDFIFGTILERLKIAEKINKDKDRKKAMTYVRNIYAFSKNKGILVEDLARCLLTASREIGKPTSPIKMTLEHIALILPLQKK